MVFQDSSSRMSSFFSFCLKVILRDLQIFPEIRILRILELWMGGVKKGSEKKKIDPFLTPPLRAMYYIYYLLFS